MKRIGFILTFLFLCAFGQAIAQGSAPRLRVVVLTDIENEPDDAQSMVRFLTYSNHWDVEALIATTSTHKKDKPATGRIREIVSAYGKVRANLLLHEKGFPEEKFLQGIIKEGYSGYGMAAVGEGKDSEGSDWLLKVLEKDDSRPVYVTIWGGANCLAQTLYKLRMTHSPARAAALVNKIRVYTISDQDDAGPWIRKQFPTLFYIISPGYHAAGAYHYATWSGISGDRFSGKFSGADFSIVDNPWLDEHVRKNHGPLGAEYPFTKFLMEGDTPSFLYLINNGLSDPEHPDYGSWGGRYELYTPRMQKWFYEPETRPIWTDAIDDVQGIDSNFYSTNKATIWRWRQAYQHDFAARMDWTVKPFREANHPPVVSARIPAELAVKSGESISLSAEGCTDPDGHTLSYEWMYYAEPGSFNLKEGIEIRDKTAMQASFVAPKVMQPQTIHVILKVTDNGSPSLTRYRRVIVTVFPK